MAALTALDSVALDATSRQVLDILLHENPELEVLLRSSKNLDEVRKNLRRWVSEKIADRPEALAFYEGNTLKREAVDVLDWSDLAAIRLLDYLDNAGLELPDQNCRGKVVQSDPIQVLWRAVAHNRGGAERDFFIDMLELFRQLEGRRQWRVPDKARVERWMDRHPSGLDQEIVELREANRGRLLNVLVDMLNTREIRSRRYQFGPHMSRARRLELAREWWKDSRFHVRFAIRNPMLLNRLLDDSLDDETMEVLEQAKAEGIPFFINPYYLSLLNVRAPDFAANADLAIREYVLYSRDLVEEYGHIKAWEMEDIVVPGKPNGAGWILPSHNEIHRRYPEVAILIPRSRGRACGGLCTSCQRMYDFQSGNLNFKLDKLAPSETFVDRMAKLMAYFRDDSQLRDVLLTGGDALMSSDRTLRKIFDAILTMARDKIEANKSRPDGEKYAELLRVRLGTRLPVYLPQRVTPELCELLAEFKREASELGVQQFVIQTHFETAMEVTPEAREAIGRLLKAGWTVSNQLVFTAAASRRGHTAKLRKVLGEIGVLSSYTFSVKGYRENRAAFATNARSVQEQLEEKYLGTLTKAQERQLLDAAKHPETLVESIAQLKEQTGLPFIATDRNVLNLPAVGKSMTFRVIGLTTDGRRVLEFDHDPTRKHSPIIDKIGKVRVIESKSISAYLEQLERMGENLEDYESLYGYSASVTTRRNPLFQYPDYVYAVTPEITNLRID